MRAGWLRSPTHDLAIAFIWVPLAVAAHVAARDPSQLRWIVTTTLLLSFAHQPLTLWLVYGDQRQRDAYRALFRWAPLIVVVVVAAGTAIQPTAVALVGGVWNLAHTLRQRYGVSRLYGRLRHIDCGSDNRLLWAWLSAAVLIAVTHADLAVLARQVGVGDRNTIAVDALSSARVVAASLLPGAAAIAAVLTARSVQAELRRSIHSRARLAYLGSTALLLALLAVEPATGFVAFVGAHAAEYLFIVRWRIDRAATKHTVGDRVGALARRVGGGGTLVLYAAAVVPLTRWIGAPRGEGVGVVAFLTLGALHFLYDGFIWRTPARPPEARYAVAGSSSMRRVS
jgi:hypothetical protein